MMSTTAARQISCMHNKHHFYKAAAVLIMGTLRTWLRRPFHILINAWKKQERI
jgi:hypothetical protein